MPTKHLTKTRNWKSNAIDTHTGQNGANEMKKSDFLFVQVKQKKKRKNWVFSNEMNENKRNVELMTCQI